jgi:putative membrane protein
MTTYCGPAPIPTEAAIAWNLDPVLVAGLAMGMVLIRRAARPGIGLAGVIILAVAFVSPLCAISVALFSARALHHILIVAAAAPLIALAFPAGRSGALGAAFVAATGVLWLWHLPAFYDRALANTLVYWVMQLGLLASAIWFWRSLFAAPPVPASLATIAAMAQMGMLGALLTFAPHALYAAHFTTTLAWGISPLGDQQLAGLIMWVPGIIPYALVLAVVAKRGWAAIAATP